MREVNNMMTPVKHVAPQDVAADQQSTGIDCSGYDEVIYLMAVGATTGTGETLDVKIQESDLVGGTYTDIAGAAFAQVIADGATQVKLSVKVNNAKPWQRVFVDVAGTSPTFLMSVVGLLVNPYKQPA